MFEHLFYGLWMDSLALKYKCQGKMVLFLSFHMFIILKDISLLTSIITELPPPPMKG